MLIRLKTRWPVMLLISLFMILVVRRAWVCDDAYITLRTVDNWVHGYGLTWNVAERVQSYTHPLWMLVLSAAYAVTGEAFLTTIGLSLLISFCTVVVVGLYLARTPSSGLIAILVFTFSQAFVDYATSGLENPLSHLLLALFMSMYLGHEGHRSPRSLLWLSLLASLGVVNRLDSLLLYAPMLGWAFWKGASLNLCLKGRRLAWLALGQLPLLLWEGFSIVYYGFTLPNTALAKLNTAIPRAALIEQGLHYLWNSLRADPLTLFTVGAVVTACLAGRFGATKRGEERFFSPQRCPGCKGVSRKTPKAVGVPGGPAMAAALGIFLTLCYVVMIGGDFASGRFLTVPFLCAVCVGAGGSLSVPGQDNRTGQTKKQLLALSILVLGIIPAQPTLVVHLGDSTDVPRWTYIDERGIADERMWYQATNALFAEGWLVREPTHLWREDGLRLKARGSQVALDESIGMVGYYAGPRVYLVDQWALADPLLARLPAYRQVRWRIGHFDRVIPEGYLETLEAAAEGHDDKRIADPNLAEFYRRLRVVTQGPIWSAERWAEMWRFWRGQNVALIDRTAYRLPFLVRVHAVEVGEPVEQGASWRSRAHTTFYDSGVEITLADVQHAAGLEISVQGDDLYQVQYLNGEKVVAEQTLPETSGNWMVVHRAVVPRRAVRRGYDGLRVLPLWGDEVYVLGHVRVMRKE